MKNTDFNLLAKKAFESAKKRGFYNEKHTDAHYIMLILCELAEAVEADRFGKRADRKTYEFLSQDYGDVLKPHLFEMHIKDTVEDEFADAVVYLLSYVGMKGFKIHDDYITEENIERTLNSTFRTDDWSDLKTFAERVYVTCVNNLTTMGTDLPEATIYSIFAVAKLYGIDLMWFVREKMKYNDLREFLHGKAY